MNNEDVIMNSNIQSNINVTPMETEDGIVRLVPQTTDIEITPTTIGSLINPPVSSTIIPHVNQLAPIITALNNPPVSTSVPLSNLLMSPITSLNNTPMSAISSLSNPPVSTIVSLNNASISTIKPLHNTPVSTIPVLNNPSVVTTTQQNIVLQQQLHQLQQQPLQQQIQVQQQQPQLMQQLQQQQPQQQQQQQPQQQQQQQQQQQLQQQPQQQQHQQQQQPIVKSIINTDNTALLTKTRLRELIKEVDPNEQLEEDVEDLMLQISDDFVDELIKAACIFAKHRKSSIVEVKDVQMYLERYLNMRIPGFGTDELRPYKKAPITEAHKQRTALIKKVSSKKY